MGSHSVQDSYACRMCFGACRVQLSLTPTPIANSFPDRPDKDAERYPLDVQECLSCGHVQLKHQARVDWHNYAYRTPGANRPHLAAAAYAIRQRYPGVKTALEIGSNNGLYLEELRNVGIEAQGVDPNASDGIPAPFTWEMARHLKRVDLVVANNVLAHVDDLHDVFNGIDTILNDDGALVFEVQYLPALIESGSFDMIYHEHRDYHTTKPWPQFLKRYGLVINRLEHLETHGGSMRFWCERPGWATEVYDECLDWKGLKHLIRDAKESIQRQLLEVDGPIAAFGATAKACTLIHHFGIADQIAYCIDETPEKQHRYIPGTNIMIQPLKHLEANPPAAVLLTAWNFADHITARFPHLNFIIPFQKETVCR